jgi:hypothetical protein
MPTLSRRLLAVAAFLVAVQAFSWTQQTSNTNPDAGKLKPTAKNAPKDKPADIKKEGENKFEEAIAPYVAQARASLPKTKKRFQGGLKQGEILYVTTRLYTPEGKFEQVFVQVESWKDKTIAGLLATDVTLVEGHIKARR